MRIFVMAAVPLLFIMTQSAQGEVSLGRQQLAQAGQKLTGKELAAAISGKKLSSRRREGVSGADMTRVVRPRYEFTVSFYFRTDGSFHRECVSHEPQGDVSCGPADGRTNVGTWLIENDRVCLRGVRHEGRSFMCGAATRVSPTVLYMQWQPIPPALDGPWNLGNP
jgi:hypothetical protein